LVFFDIACLPDQGKHDSHAEAALWFFPLSRRALAAGWRFEHPIRRENGFGMEQALFGLRNGAKTPQLSGIVELTRKADAISAFPGWKQPDFKPHAIRRKSAK